DATGLARTPCGHGSARGVESSNRLLETIAADETHRVIGPAVGVGPQPVNGDDTRMLEPGGDLGLHQEPGAIGLVVGVAVEDLLEGDFAVELAVERHEYRPEAPLRMRPQHPEPLPVGARGARLKRYQGLAATCAHVNRVRA